MAIRSALQLLTWPPEVEAARLVVIKLEARHLRARVLNNRPALRRFEAAKRRALGLSCC